MTSTALPLRLIQCLRYLDFEGHRQQEDIEDRGMDNALSIQHESLAFMTLRTMGG